MSKRKAPDVRRAEDRDPLTLDDPAVRQRLINSLRALSRSADE